MELILNQPDLPGLFIMAEVFEVVVAVHVDEVVFHVFGVVALFFKPCVEFVVVHF